MIMFTNICIIWCATDRGSARCTLHALSEKRLKKNLSKFVENCILYIFITYTNMTWGKRRAIISKNFLSLAIPWVSNNALFDIMWLLKQHPESQNKSLYKYAAYSILFWDGDLFSFDWISIKILKLYLAKLIHFS